MFSFIQLKSSSKFNSFRRLIFKYSKSMFVKEDIKKMKFYVLKRLLNKRIYRRDKGESMKYLIK